MKTKKITFLTSFVFLFTGIVLIFTGCEQDYYDPSRQQGTGASLFGDSITVPATFDWATTRNVDMRVKVEDNFNGAYLYTVQIFDANPLFDEEATLLGMGVAKNNSDFSTNVVIPEALTTVYIQQTSPTGGKTIAPVGLIGSSLNYSFSPQDYSASALVSVRSSSSTNESSTAIFRSTTDPYPVPELPVNHTVITQSSGELTSNIAGDVYLINGNFSGTTNFWRKVDLFVQGTLNVTSGQLNLPPGSRLIVLPGALVTTPKIDAWGETTSEDIYIQGTLTVNGEIKVNKNSKLVVFEGGSVVVDNNVDLLSNTLFSNNGTVEVNGKLQTSNANTTVVNDGEMTLNQLEVTQNSGLYTNNGTLIVSEDLKISNNGQVVNNNTITTNSLTLDNGTFNNEGVITVLGPTAVTNSTASIINQNSFTTNTLSLQGNARVENNCHMIVEGLLNTTDASIIVGPGGLLSTSNLFMNNTRIELDRAAMMKVTVEAVYKYNKGGDQWNNDGFYGTGSNKALLQIAKAVAEEINDENIIHYQGNLEIECYDHPSKNIDSWNARWTEDGVTWAGEGGSTLVIPGTECNDGGYSNVPSTPPSNPVFPIIWNGTDVTYMFEDNWPLLGDYDMNDVVFNMKPEYTIDAGNKVTQLKLDVTLRAVGGVKRLAVGMQIDGMARNVVSSVSRSSQAGRDNSVFSASNGLETGQDYVVIPIFDDVHKALGIPAGTMVNTTVGGSIGTVSPAVVTFTLTFNSPVDRETVSIDKLNPFIVNGGYKNRRDEVHLPGFAPTDKADIFRFGAGDDDSSNNYYTSKGNLIWALAIPGATRYPKEYTSIRKAYPQLESWATTSGQSDKDWYMHPDLTFIYDK
ncbi:LruC domain-containing protein [Dysgonomonadaceae bacterium zrk40]|nr:LruC domain-containing protein [Dysgonomonadaceae bacterium zrk40]